MIGVLRPILSDIYPKGISKKILNREKLEMTKPIRAPEAPRLWANSGRIGLAMPTTAVTNIPTMQRIMKTLGYVFYSSAR